VLKDIVAVEALEGYVLRLRFEGGAKGQVTLTELVPFEGVFAPLRTPAYFQSVQLNTELGAIAWPNGADLDPDVLYARITGMLLPQTDTLIT
jgi:hypothetical protein